MIFLGIDPGFSVTGFGVLKKENNKIIMLESGALKLNTQKSLPERSGEFFNYFDDTIKKWGVSDLSLETPFLYKNAQNFLKLGYLRGILYLLANKNNLKIHEFAPREIKLALTGYGNAPKEQVARVVCQLFPGLVFPSKLDITDAIAVTLCATWKNNKTI